jgi:hypothetical protein
MITWQREFVAWWDREVGVRHAGDTKNADRRSCISKDVAETRAQITQQQLAQRAQASRGLCGPAFSKRDDRKATGEMGQSYRGRQLRRPHCPGSVKSGCGYYQQ